MLPSHVHIFALPNTTTAELPAKCGGCKEGQPGKPPCSKAAYFTAAQPWSAGFHVASMNWTINEQGLSTVAIGVDGAVVSTIISPCLDQEIGME